MVRIIENATCRVKRDLDISHMFRKLQEIDKLKSILLDTTQEVMFDNMLKPTISIFKIDHELNL
jgi:hypothetical protein